MTTGTLQVNDASKALELMRKHWLQPGKQAAEIVDAHDNLRSLIVPHLRTLQSLGIQPWQPAQHTWMVVLGALYTAIQKRVKVAADVWNYGVQWKMTAFLGSLRPRYDANHPSKKETDEIITKPVVGGFEFDADWTAPALLPGNEGGLIEMVLDQVSSHLPWNREAECRVIATNPSAGTKETLEAFCQEQDPHGESVLIIGSQPHMLRQQMIAASVLGDRFERVEATGYDMPVERLNLSQALDEIAKLAQLVVPA